MCVCLCVNDSKRRACVISEVKTRFACFIRWGWHQPHNKFIEKSPKNILMFVFYYHHLRRSTSHSVRKRTNNGLTFFFKDSTKVSLGTSNAPQTQHKEHIKIKLGHLKIHLDPCSFNVQKPKPILNETKKNVYTHIKHEQNTFFGAY